MYVQCYHFRSLTTFRKHLKGDKLVPLVVKGTHVHVCRFRCDGLRVNVSQKPRAAGLRGLAESDSPKPKSYILKEV